MEPKRRKLNEVPLHRSDTIKEDKPLITFFIQDEDDCHQSVHIDPLEHIVATPIDTQQQQGAVVVDQATKAATAGAIFRLL